MRMADFRIWDFVSAREIVVFSWPRNPEFLRLVFNPDALGA
jgi:hypothetical protein